MAGLLDQRQDIRCTKCDKKLAERGARGVLEARNGDQVLRVHRAEVVTIKCGKCGQINDVSEEQ